MLVTGSDKLRRMQDGRAVYIGSERVDDVTTHPAFAGGARTVADIYDRKAADDALSYEENGQRHSIWWLRPRTRDDLARRMAGHKRVADMTFGFFGRSPDHIASLITGLATKPD